MNALARTLRQAPSAQWRDLRQSYGDEIPFTAIWERLPATWEAPRQSELAALDLVWSEFGASFAGVLSSRTWTKAMKATAGRVTADPAEWVTFVPMTDGWGLTLPEDSYPVRRFAMFVRRGDAYQRRSIDFVRGSSLAVAETIGSSHCGFPVQMNCESGHCGQCRLARRWAEPPGLVCLCPHS
jgi:hypothetical protein